MTPILFTKWGLKQLTLNRYTGSCCNSYKKDLDIFEQQKKQQGDNGENNNKPQQTTTVRKLMTDGYLSQNRDYLNKAQRERRARYVRIDYMPSKKALAIIETKRGPRYPFCINSGILDAIVIEWAERTGIK